MKTVILWVLLLLNLSSFGQNCDCNTINVPPECRKKCGPLLLSTGSENQLKNAFPKLPDSTRNKIPPSRNRKNKTSPKDFKSELTPVELSLLQNEYNNWETTNYTVTVSGNNGTSVGVMNGGTIQNVTNNYGSVNEKPEPTKEPNLKNISGTWVGTFDADDWPDGFTMVMDAKIAQNKIYGTIKLNWSRNNNTYAIFSFNGIVKNNKVTIDENTATQVYGTRTWLIKQYNGTLEMDGTQMKLSGTWNNDSHKVYDWGKIIISGTKHAGGHFELTKLKN